MSNEIEHTHAMSDEEDIFDENSVFPTPSPSPISIIVENGRAHRQFVPPGCVLKISNMALDFTATMGTCASGFIFHDGNPFCLGTLTMPECPNASFATPYEFHGPCTLDFGVLARTRPSEHADEEEFSAISLSGMIHYVRISELTIAALEATDTEQEMSFDAMAEMCAIEYKEELISAEGEPEYNEEDEVEPLGEEVEEIESEDIDSEDERKQVALLKKQLAKEEAMYAQSEEEEEPKIERRRRKGEPSEKKGAPEPTWTTIKGGVKIRDLTVGNGEVVQRGNRVKVKYEGRLKNGKVFDAGSFKTKIGVGNVIKGWDLGLTNKKYPCFVGTVRELIIPPKMGYGAQGTTGIPGNSTLFFTVEVLAIRR
ncbi:hypothetical protein PCE1_000832 [Barthelona sp. PCE]